MKLNTGLHRDGEEHLNFVDIEKGNRLEVNIKCSTYMKCSYVPSFEASDEPH